MSKNTFTIDLGTVLDSTPKIISCFCQNWEIGDALLRRRFNIYRIDKNTWKGSRYGIKVDWKLEHFTEDYSNGDFIFLGRAFLLGFTASAVVKIDYERLSYHRVYVHGFLEVERKEY